MTENEAIKEIHVLCCNEQKHRSSCVNMCKESCMYGDNFCPFQMAIKALEEVQEYRKIGTVEEIKDLLVVISEASDNADEDGIDLQLIKDLIELKKYRDIGTLEEFSEAVEKQKHGWIPVEERLPEEQGNYLVTFNNGKISLVGYGFCRMSVLGKPIGYGWYDKHSGNYFSDDAIIAWRPLPDKYRPEVKNG